MSSRDQFRKQTTQDWNYKAESWKQRTYICKDRASLWNYEAYIGNYTAQICKCNN